MILSNIEIHKALDEGRLKITPEPSPREPGSESKIECPYQTTSVDLRLSDEISFFKKEAPFNIDISNGGFARLFSAFSESYKIPQGQPYVLEPNKLVLGRTLEKVELPIVKDGISLAARVEGKSSYARCGLLVHFTAPTIHAGFAGTITLELINLGPCKIALSPGTPICQLIIETVSGTPIRNDSQFQNQSKPGGN